MEDKCYTLPLLKDQCICLFLRMKSKKETAKTPPIFEIAPGKPMKYYKSTNLENISGVSIFSRSSNS